jgi:hypothetical protein
MKPNIALCTGALIVALAHAAGAAPTSPASATSPATAKSAAATKPAAAHKGSHVSSATGKAAAPGQAGAARPGGGPRRLEDIHIEGEIPAPQVLFISARDQRRFVESRHKHYLRTAREIGEATPQPTSVVVTQSANGASR